MEGERNDVNDEEHHEAFGKQTNISEECRYEIYLIKNNDPDFKGFKMDPMCAASFSDFALGVLGGGKIFDVEHFSDLAWELLGRYIAENDHLEELTLGSRRITDEKTTLLFKYLTRSMSLKTLCLLGNSFGPGGVQSMIPFLKNSPNLKILKIGYNRQINVECFRCLVNSLHGGGSIENLSFGKCSIDDITILEIHSLPHLKILNLECNNIRIIPSLDKYTNLEELLLDGNSIGMQGCRSISNLLQNNSSRLRYLYLACNDIGDEEAEILVDSLKYNTTLNKLTLGGNKFKEKGLRAFLMLLNDISSIERTSNSNHTLKTLGLPEFTHSKSAEMKKHICSSLTINRGSDAPGQQKVIKIQLNSVLRMELCHLQGIEYSYNSIFANIDDVFLPNVIALAGQNHGQNELYRMLIATAPAYASIVDRKGILKERMDEYAIESAALKATYAGKVEDLGTAHARSVEKKNAKYARKMAALTAEHLRENVTLAAQRLKTKRELESIESGGGGHSVDGTNISSVRKPGGKKRGRGK